MHIYLLKKVVGFCFVPHVEIPQTIVLPIMHFVSLENPWWVQMQGHSEPTPTSAPSIRCPLLFFCGWISGQLSQLTLATNPLGNRSHTSVNPMHNAPVELPPARSLPIAHSGFLPRQPPRPSHFPLRLFNLLIPPVPLLYN